MSLVNSDMHRGKLRLQLIGMLTAVMALSVLGLGIAIVAAFDRAIAPELENRTRLIGSIVRAEIQRVTQLGIPLQSLGGLDAYLQDSFGEFAEVKRIAVITAKGSVVAEITREDTELLFADSALGMFVGVSRSEFSLPVLVGNNLVGEVIVVGNPRFAETRLKDVFLDVAVLAIVALLLGVELALALAARSVWKPLGRIHHLLGEQGQSRFLHTIVAKGSAKLGRIADRLNDQAEDITARFSQLSEKAQHGIAARLDAHVAAGAPDRLRYSDIYDMRLVLFVFVIGTEITASFLPVFARDVVRPDWVRLEIASAAPLIAYLTSIALVSLFAGSFVQKFGPRRVFFVSAVAVVAALIGLGLSDSLLEITIWRGAIAAFFGPASLACLRYSVSAEKSSGGAGSTGTYFTIIFGGVLSGSILGGVIASRFGFENAIFTGAGLAAVSASLGLLMMNGRAGDPGPKIRKNSVESSRATGALPPGMSLLVGISIPANIATAIFIWYLTPVIIVDAGGNVADVARVVMLYYLAAVFVGPLAGILSDTRISPPVLITVGGGTAAAALLLAYQLESFWIHLFSVAVLGIGHALIRAPQLKMVLNMSQARPGLQRIFSVSDRVGALIGLGAGAILHAVAGSGALIVAVGILVSIGVVGFALSQMAALVREKGGAR